MSDPADQTLPGASSGAVLEGAAMPADPAHDDIEQLSYEAARDELVAVVDRLERGGSTLEESLALWERGEALAARCERWLVGARARLDQARGPAAEA
jgi:exodeoxyribonuclease VII small subunit